MNFTKENVERAVWACKEAQIDPDFICVAVPLRKIRATEEMFAHFRMSCERLGVTAEDAANANRLWVFAPLLALHEAMSRSDGLLYGHMGITLPGDEIGYGEPISLPLSYLTVRDSLWIDENPLKHTLTPFFGEALRTAFEQFVT